MSIAATTPTAKALRPAMIGGQGNGSGASATPRGTEAELFASLASTSSLSGSTVAVRR
jgi:hypothetical protein